MLNALIAALCGWWLAHCGAMWELALAEGRVHDATVWRERDEAHLRGEGLMGLFGP